MLTVKQYQKNLTHYYAYYTGPIDGIVGPKTVAAIKAFQRGHSVFADGIYGVDTNARLVSSIKSLQGKLSVTKDGIIGSDTIAAIKATLPRGMVLPISARRNSSANAEEDIVTDILPMSAEN